MSRDKPIIRKGATEATPINVSISTEGWKKLLLEQVTASFKALSDLQTHPGGQATRRGGGTPPQSDGERLSDTLESLADHVDQFLNLPNLTRQDRADLQAALSSGAVAIHAGFEAAIQDFATDMPESETDIADVESVQDDVDRYLGGLLHKAGVSLSVPDLVIIAEAAYGETETDRVDGASELTGTVASPSRMLELLTDMSDEVVAQASDAPDTGNEAAPVIAGRKLSQQQQELQQALSVAYSALTRIDDETARLEKVQEQMRQSPSASAGADAANYTATGTEAVVVPSSGSQVKTDA